MTSIPPFLPITCGVPQDPVLGPMLFIMCINDLDTYLTDSKVSLYADDTALYCTADTQVELMVDLRVEFVLFLNG